MTKEELKKEAEEYYEDETEGTFQICEDCYWFADAVQTAYVDSAEPREKQIQIDAIQIRALQKQNGELTDKVKELEAQLSKLKPYRCKNHYQVSEAGTRNAVVCYRMYDCENCGHFKETK